MIKTSKILFKECERYSNPYAKIERLCKQGKLIKIKRGLYETNADIPGQFLAENICAPSYLSFDYALAYYDLIPEGVCCFTSASYGKRKRKEFSTHFGLYTYDDVPKSVYKYGINVIEENGYFYKIATPEKALCDKLYSLKPVKNLSEIKTLLFKDLRIDEDNLFSLNKGDILFLSEKYKCTNIYLLAKLFRKEKV